MKITHCFFRLWKQKQCSCRIFDGCKHELNAIPKMKCFLKFPSRIISYCQNAHQKYWKPDKSATYFEIKFCVGESKKLVLKHQYNAFFCIDWKWIQLFWHTLIALKTSILSYTSDYTSWSNLQLFHSVLQALQTLWGIQKGQTTLQQTNSKRHV